MSRFQKIIFLGFLFVIGALVYLEASKPPTISWRASYSRVDKIPLGTYVFHDLVSNKLETDFIEKDRPPFEVLSDSISPGTYFFVNDQVTFDRIEIEKILSWVEEGNTLFVSANYHSSKLLDTLSIELNTEVSTSSFISKPMFDLVNPNLKATDPYLLDRDFAVRSFSEIDTLTQTVLGISQIYNDTLEITRPSINFIKAPFGNGNVLLHTQPEVFSNYFLLEKDENIAYVKGLLSYMNNNTKFYWDNHYKSGKPIEMSPLYIILNNKYLKWAYYFILIGALLFVLFEGKRKQRYVPIVKPLENKTYEYTRTISGMYLDQKQHHLIALKQVSLFMEYIRTQLRIPTENVNYRFMQSVAARSNNNIEDTKTLFNFIEKIQHQRDTSMEELHKLNKEITTYKTKIDGTS